jgi:hypothetical protein
MRRRSRNSHFATTLLETKLCFKFSSVTEDGQQEQETRCLDFLPLLHAELPQTVLFQPAGHKTARAVFAFHKIHQHLLCETFEMLHSCHPTASQTRNNASKIVTG